MEKTLWETLADAFDDEDIEVYPPATKEGECKERYVVIKDDGSNQIGSYSSQQRYYTFLIYTPQHRYTDVERNKEYVKDIVSKKLYPLLMPTGTETPDFWDDTYKAYMVSVQYRCNIRNKHL